MWTESEIVCLIWTALLGSMDWSSRVDQIEATVIKLITPWCPTLALYSTSAKSQLALLLHIQSFCYNDSRFLKNFRIIVQNLYKFDVLSESAIMYWFEKGASAQGKNVLVAQIEPFVNWLREQESESEEDE